MYNIDIPAVLIKTSNHPYIRRGLIYRRKLVKSGTYLYIGLGGKFQCEVKTSSYSITTENVTQEGVLASFQDESPPLPEPPVPVKDTVLMAAWAQFAAVALAKDPDLDDTDVIAFADTWVANLRSRQSALTITLPV